MRGGERMVAARELLDIGARRIVEYGFTNWLFTIAILLIVAGFLYWWYMKKKK